MNKKQPVISHLLRIKGFTLIEIMISLIISSILISITLIVISTFRNVSKNHENRWTLNNQVIEVLSLLQNDLNNCHKAIIIGSDKISLTGEIIIAYQFNSPAIIRSTENSVDTLYVKFQDLELDNIPEIDSLLKTCSFKIVDGETLYPVRVIKRYGVTEKYNFQISCYEN